MLKQLRYLSISVFLSLCFLATLHSQVIVTDSINDGPYIFYLDSDFEVKWIENNLFHTENINQKKFSDTKKKFNLLFDYKDLKKNRMQKADYKQTYKDVDSIAAISDIHGEYYSYIKLLKAMGIIDDNLNWKFGKGHLVVLGDSFDRGPMVTEILWHLFGLEKQAALAGGMVHVMLGNHESMVLSNDLRYINNKYRKVELISGINYSTLFSTQSVLGNWLDNQPAIISINDIIFVHGGLSIEVVRRKMNIEEINHTFSDMMVRKEELTEIETENIKFLEEDTGPFWYRGYFTNENYCSTKIDSILAFYKKSHIVVGHTSSKEIKTFFDNKVFGIDAGLGNNEPGEMLIYKNGIFYKGLVSGKRIKL
jgi:hypothetical protein